MQRLNVVADRWLELLKAEHRERAKPAFPDGKELEGSFFIPWNMTNARRLAAMQLPAVSTLVRDYDFPSYRPAIPEPMPHQVQVADFICLHRRCYVFAGTGTGKTISSLWAYDYLRSIGMVDRLLVVCPLSIVDESWGDTIATHFKHLSYSTITGTPKRKKELLANKHAVHIINFDGVVNLRDIMQENNYSMVVVDESPAIKNVSTNRWKALYQVVPDHAQLVLQTGTPISQGPMDAYGQVRLMGNKPVAKTSARFRDDMMRRVTEFKWVPRDDAQDKLRELLSPAIRLATRDVLKHLPPITYTYRRVEMTKTQQTLFNRLRREQIADHSEGTITAVHAAALLTKLMQTLAGAVYDDEGNVVRVDAGPRVAETLDIIRNSDSKTIVYAPFRAAIDLLAEALTKEGITFEVIHGGVTAKERVRIFREFQRTDNAQVLLAIPDAMAHGVTATAASTIVWFMGTTKNEVYIQANARIDRQGQQLPTHVVHLVSHHLEKERYQSQQQGLDFQQDTLTLYKRMLEGA